MKNILIAGFKPSISMCSRNCVNVRKIMKSSKKSFGTWRILEFFLPNFENSRNFLGVLKNLKATQRRFFSEKFENAVYEKVCSRPFRHAISHTCFRKTLYSEHIVHTKAQRMVKPSTMMCIGVRNFECIRKVHLWNKKIIRRVWCI